jgi:predicted signal transduction protein with EAL and GGDEF domain
MTSSQTYLLGFIILIIGLAAAAYMLAVPPVWIAVGVVILIGIGIISAASYHGSGDR